MADLSPEQIVEEARENWKLTTQVYGPQVERETEDCAFLDPERQWSDAARRMREGASIGAATVGTVQVPGRPTLSISRIAQPKKLIVNQMRSAHLGINVHPLSEDANKETADVIQGLYRKIERDSRAWIARTWAFDRATTAGRGVYQVNYVKDEESGHPFDLKIVMQRLLDQACAYFDPSAKEPDWSDGNWAFVARWLSRKTFVKEFGKKKGAKVASGGNMEWEAATSGAPAWVRGTGTEKEAVLVVDYYRKTFEDGPEIALLSDWSVVPVDKVPRGAKIIRTQDSQIQKLWWYCLTGLEPEPLDSQEWNGKHIPLVPVIGNELQPFDEERRWQGIVRPAKDAQRMFNYAASGAVEMAALEPRAPWLVDPRQVAKYKDFWEQSNTRNLVYLPYDAISEAGQPLPPPQRVQIDAGRLGPNMLLLQNAGEWIKDTTNVYDASLGNLNPKDRSGKALQALQGQADAATGDFLQNFVDISLPYEAKVVLDLLPTCYERPGRIAEILDGEDKSRRVMLNIPFRQGDDGELQKAETNDKQAQTFDLRRGVYGVATEAGKSYQTRLQAGQEALTNLIGAVPPELAEILLPVMMRFQDFPGATEAADKIQKFVDMKFPQLQKKEGEQPTPEQLRAENDALKAQGQQAQQMLQQAGMAIKTDQAKQQATIEKAKIDAQVAAAKAQDDNQTKIAVAQINQAGALAVAELKAGQERAAEEMAQQRGILTRIVELIHEKRMDDEQGAHEVGLESMKQHGASQQREHDKAMAERQMGHAAGLAGAQAAQGEQESEAERAHESEMAETAAKQAAESQADGSGE